MAVLARLRRRTDFLRVAGGRNRWVTPGLILQTLARPTDDGKPASEPLRVGYTATRRVGSSVVRNRARRRLRAAAAAVMPHHAAPDFDYVLIARADTPTRPYAALVGDLELALRRLGTWRDTVSREDPGRDAPRR